MMQMDDKNINGRRNCCIHCADVRTALARLEERFRDLEQRKWNADNSTSTQSRTLSNIIAEHVGVIGLRESITWPHRPLKIIWALFLLAGFGATIYYLEQNIEKYLGDNTATKVSFTQLPDYPFPRFVACPPLPYNVDKALSTGLSVDAFKYSLGYFVSDTTVFDFPLRNVTGAKREFLHFYSKRNFTTFTDYYQSIAADIVHQVVNGTCEGRTVCYSCVFCNASGQSVVRTVENSGVCYSFSFPSATSKMAYVPPKIYLWNWWNNPGMSLEGEMPPWKVELLPNIGVVGPQNTLGPGRYTMIVSSHKIKLEDNSDECDLKPNRIDQPDPTKQCLEQCLKRRQQSLGAYFNFLNASRWPGDILNYYDLFESHSGIDTVEDLINVTRKEPAGDQTATTGARPGNGAKLEDCSVLCKLPCDRTVYELTVHYNNKEYIDSFSDNHTSSIELSFEHTGLRQGFVIYEEMETMTFSDFISNIGGTFGLFLGCTFFTLLQLALSMMNYFYEGKYSR